MHNNQMLSEKTSPSEFSHNTPQNIKEVWNTTWNWIANESQVVTKIVVKENEVYVIGHAGAMHQIYVEKFDDFGNHIWRRTWYGGIDAEAYDAVVVSNYIYIAGRSLESTNANVTLLKYDSDGNLIWNISWDSGSSDYGFGLTYYYGYLYLAGQSTINNPIFNEQALLLKFDTDGHILWNMQWGGKDSDYAMDVAGMDGYIYLTGWANKDSALLTSDAMLLKYDQNGNLIWNRTWAIKEIRTEAYKLIATSNEICSTGTILNDATSQYNAFVRCYDPDGIELWDRTTPWGPNSAQDITSIANDIYVPVGYKSIWKLDLTGNFETVFNISTPYNISFTTLIAAKGYLYGGSTLWNSTGNTIGLFLSKNTDLASIGQWTQMNPLTGPTARTNHAMAYDSKDKVTVLFGGNDGYNKNDTWTYNSTTNVWTNMNPSSGPSARINPGMAYDSKSDRIILYGGGYDSSIGYTAYNDTWAYDLNNNTWTNMKPKTNPYSMRECNVMAYDSKNDRVILFGGWDVINDTWVYDFENNTWQDISPSISPPTRIWHNMAYDSRSDRIIMFGGYNDSTNFNDTWTYDYDTNTWVNKTPFKSPPPQAKHAMAYDSLSDRIIIFGGLFSGGTWAYDFNNNNWSKMNSSISPSNRNGHAITYDSSTDRIVLFGGSGGGSDSWSYDYKNDTWKDMNPLVHPSGDIGSPMAYNSKSNRVILFGGFSNETWAYDFNNNTWDNMHPSVSPSSRSWAAMAYDSKSDRIILFGGDPGMNETWAYDYDNNTWKKMNPAQIPYSMRFHAVAYDSKSDRVILFGGQAGPPDDRTWAYDYDNDNWTEMKPLTHPSGRKHTAMAYDSHSDRTILFGGDIGGPSNDETWSYDFNNNTWTQINLTVHPSERYGHAMVYDSMDDRIILFGGATNSAGGNYLDKTWAFNYNNMTWTQMNPRTSPSPRLWYCMAYDSQSNQAILYGGASSIWPNDDTWAYKYGIGYKFPYVVSTDPHAETTNISVYTNISVTFSEEMDTAVTEGAISSSPSITGNFIWDGTAKVMTWKPKSYLLPFTNYEITISTTAQSKLGLNMMVPYSFTFTTGDSPPVVMSTDPMNGSKDFPLNKSIKIAFSKAMNTSATEGAISAVPSITGAYTWDTSQKVLFWAPTMNLTANTNYSITISKNAKGANGLGLKDTYIFSFTTGSNTDFTPPVIMNTIPKNGDTGVSLDATITIQWSKNMDQASAESAFTITPAITCIWSWNDTVQICTPNAPLLPNTRYNVTITVQASDLVGNRMKDPFLFTFLTGPKIEPVAVVSTNPANGSINVPLDAAITITFNRPMNRTATENAISSSPSIAWRTTWSINDTVITLTPSQPLRPGTSYAIRISTAAKSYDGVNLESDYNFSFTTMIVAASPASDMGPAIVTIGVVAVVVAIGCILSIEWVLYSIALLLLPLYTRIKKEQVLDHFLRGQIYEFIRANPGTHLRMILRELKIPMGVLCHHLSVLERSGKIRSENKVYLKKYYRIPKGGLEDGFKLKSLQKKMIEVIADRPGLTAISISKRLGIKHLVAIDNLRLLSELEYLEPRHTSHGVRYYPGKKSIEDVGENPRPIEN